MVQQDLCKMLRNFLETGWPIKIFCLVGKNLQRIAYSRTIKRQFY